MDKKRKRALLVYTIGTLTSLDIHLVQHVQEYFRFDDIKGVDQVSQTEVEEWIAEYDLIIVPAQLFEGIEQKKFKPLWVEKHKTSDSKFILLNISDHGDFPKTYLIFGEMETFVNQICLFSY